MTPSPVVEESLYHKEPFKLWMQDNTHTIATVWPDLLKHGLFIVTSTHSTKRARHTLSSDSGRLGVSADQVYGQVVHQVSD